MSVRMKPPAQLTRELKPFLVSNVEHTSNELGCGAYGCVVEVTMPGAICAAKKIHDKLLECATHEQVSGITGPMG